MVSFQGPLSPKRRCVLEYIGAKGRATAYDICVHMGWRRSDSAREKLQALRAMDYVEVVNTKMPRRDWAWRLTDLGRRLVQGEFDPSPAAPPEIEQPPRVALPDNLSRPVGTHVRPLRDRPKMSAQQLKEALARATARASSGSISMTAALRAEGVI